jgi:DNA polymerase III sliding clamp (beta) subunit (PCNA family)
MTDVFRKEYKPMDAVTNSCVTQIKVEAQNLMNIFEKTLNNMSVDTRCMNLAKINLEQAVMWAVKAIT